MASVFDVAAYLVERHGPISPMKLQKLIYYAQAWSLVWDDRPLFDQKIEAWVGGPVVRELYDAYRGRTSIQTSDVRGKAGDLDPAARETLDAVLDFYGKKSGYELSQLAHAERPWQEARVGLSPDERGDREITLESMSDYYSGLAASA